MEVTGINNPGWSFTEQRMRQINILFEFLSEKNESDVYNYKEMQREASKFNDQLNPSKIRMFIPWFERYGICNFNKDVKLYGQLLTDLGKSFSLFCPLYVQIIENEDRYSDEQNISAHQMFQSFIFKFFENIVNSDKGYIYKQIILTLEKHNHLTKDEFYLLTTMIERNKDDLWLDENITKLRQGELSLDFTKIENKNAFNYIVPFLCEAGITFLDTDKKILPAKNINFKGALENVR